MIGKSQRLWLAIALLAAGAVAALLSIGPGSSAADGPTPTPGPAAQGSAAQGSAAQGSAAQGSAAQGPTLGERPPAFTAERITGEDPLTLDAYRGNVVVLAFVSTRCRACHRALAELRELAARDRDRGLRVLAVVSEPPDRVRAFVEQAGLAFTFARVPAEAASRYDVQYIPDMFIVGRDGRLRGRVTGSQDPDIAQLRALVERLL